MTISNQAAVLDFDPYRTNTTADPQPLYGQLITTSHGRDYFRQCKVGASNISKGKLQLAPAPVANHLNLALASTSLVAVGSKRLSLTLGGTAATNGQYDQGTAHVNAGTGLGQQWNVAHNNAQATTNGTVLVDLEDPVYVLLATADSRVSLVANPYNAVVEAAVKTRTAAGVPLCDAVAGSYVYLKTKGVTSTLIGSAATVGARLTSDGTTAGAVTDNTDVTAPQTEVEVGQASIAAGTTAQYNPIVLTIG